MLKGLITVGLAMSLLAGGPALAGSTKRLSGAEKDQYYSVRVFMGEKEQKKWLKLKTVEERTAWMKQRGLWERFYQFDKDRRAKIVAGEVEIGWEQDAVLMAWGMPHQRKRMTGEL